MPPGFSKIASSVPGIPVKYISTWLVKRIWEYRCNQGKKYGERLSIGTILHLFNWDKKFVLPFRDFIHEHFYDGRHCFILYGEMAKDCLHLSSDTIVYQDILSNAFAISKAIKKADKVILHGLFNDKLLLLLAMQPWMLEKCYWAMWGGDLYVHEAKAQNWRWKIREILRAQVISRLGHFVTYIKGDYELARKWYGAKGKYHDCFVYPSNLYKYCVVHENIESTVNVLVGNSADPSNNHHVVFEMLAPFANEDIKIICPLSYGPVVNSECVENLGKEMFGDKFRSLRGFMSIEKYVELLGQIDIAVFAHNRQQALGNIITLLGLGKKIYMRSDITSWDLFADLGIKVFSLDDLQLSKIDCEISKINIDKVREHFSESNLKNQLRALFS